MSTIKNHTYFSYFCFTLSVVCFFAWKYLSYIGDETLDSTFDNQPPDSITSLQKLFFAKEV